MSFRVLSAEISHETNTFNIKPTTIEMWRARRLYRGREIIEQMAGTRSEIGAHIEAAKHYNWDLVLPIAAETTPSGKTTAEAWMELSEALLEGCKQGPFDGVILALHGAMVTEDHDDAEGDLLLRLREEIGPGVPVAITLDLHANVSDAMAERADIILAYRTYPHVDQYDVSMEAAGLLQAAMKGEIRPHAKVYRAPTLVGCDYGRSQTGPMARMLAKSDRCVKEHPGLLALSICSGFPWADTPMTGPSVTITCDGADPKFDSIAEELVNDIWEHREETTVPIYSIPDAMNAAREAVGSPGKGPLLLVDFSDNPGSGGYGDGVRLLQAMIEADLSNAVFACVPDKQAVEACQRAGIGSSVTLDLGAKVDPATYGPPLFLTGRVENLTNGDYFAEGPMLRGVPFKLGPTAVFSVGGIRIIITTHNIQVSDRQLFISQGIKPEACSVAAIKSWHHFRAAFEPLSRRVMLCDSHSLVNMELRHYEYRKVRRPVWPLDTTF